MRHFEHFILRWMLSGINYFDILTADPCYARNVSGTQRSPLRIRSWTEVQLSEGWNCTAVGPPPQDVKLNLAPPPTLHDCNFLSWFCSWPPGWQITALQALLFIIKFFSALYKFSSSISKSIISCFSSSIQYHKCSLNKIEPEFNSFGSYAVTGTEITEKGKLLCNIWNAVIYWVTIMTFHQPGTGR